MHNNSKIILIQILWVKKGTLWELNQYTEVTLQASLNGRMGNNNNNQTLHKPKWESDQVG